jgi:SAM-dependent methyltransferase
VTVWPALMRQKEVKGEPLQALDAGCGPQTWLRYGVLQGLLTVTGVDPLLEVYEILLSRHGLSGLQAIQPEHRIPVPLEALPATVPHLKHHFDFVWTNNALDHTQNPKAAIEAIAFALRGDGFAVIQVATNEGSRQNWMQLHKFDFDLHGHHLTATDERGNSVPLVGPGCSLRLDEVLHHSVDGLTLIASQSRSNDHQRAAIETPMEKPTT